MAAPLPPKPPGWEKTFDKGSGRYYFVNYCTNETSWVDPRVAVQPQQPQKHAGYGYPTQQRQPVQQQPARPQQPERVSPITPVLEHRRSSEESVLLQDLSPTHQTWVDPRGTVQSDQPQQLQQYGYPRRQHQTQPDPQRQRQPSRHVTLVRSPSPVLERRSVENVPLQDLSTRNSERGQSSQSSRTTESSLHRDVSDNSEMVSDAEKQRIVRSLKNTLDLQGVSDDLILMTLDGVLYSEDMAVQVFRSMGFKKKGEVVAVPSTSSADRWETTTQPKKKKKAKPTPSAKQNTVTASSQPIPSIQPSQPIPSLQPSQPIPSITGMSSSFEVTFADLESKFKTASGGGSDSLFKSLSSEQGSELLSKMTAAAGPSVQRMFAQQNMTSIDKMKSTARTAIPMSGSYKVPIKGQATGANKGLANGSDKSLLSKQHVVRVGADPKVSMGAQKSLAKGPSKLALGAKGTAKGADKNLRVGRNPSLAQGPLISIRAV